MGVDASYLHGFYADNNEVEFDVEYMKENFNLDRKVNDKSYNSTYGEWLEELENEEVDDWDGFYEMLGMEYHYVDYEGDYVCLNFEKLIELFPNTKLQDLDVTKNYYLKSRGIKNPEVFTLGGFAYFS